MQNPDFSDPLPSLWKNYPSTKILFVWIVTKSPPPPPKSLHNKWTGPNRNYKSSDNVHDNDHKKWHNFTKTPQLKFFKFIQACNELLKFPLLGNHVDIDTTLYSMFDFLTKSRKPILIAQNPWLSLLSDYFLNYFFQD